MAIHDDGHVSRRAALLAGAGIMSALAAMNATGLPAFAQTAPNDAGDGDNDNDDRGHHDDEWRAVAAVFGQDPNIQPGDVLQVELARSDFQTRLFGVAVDPDFATDTMITFQHVGGGAIVKWEFVLLDAEVTPVLDALFQENLQPSITTLNALHNHWIEVTPEIKYLHGTARGDGLASRAHSGVPCPTVRRPSVPSSRRAARACQTIRSRTSLAAAPWCRAACSR